MSWSSILKRGAKYETNMAHYFEGLLPDEFEESPLNPTNLNNEDLFQDALEDTDTTIKGWEQFFNNFRKLSGKPLRVAIRKKTGLNPNVYDEDVDGTIEDYISKILNEAYPKFSEKLSKKKKEEQEEKEEPVEEPIEENVGDTVRFRITGDTSHTKEREIEEIANKIKEIDEDIKERMKVEDISSEAIEDMRDKIKQHAEAIEKLKSYEPLDDDDSEVKSNIEELLSLISEEAERIEVEPRKPITYANSVDIKSKGKDVVIIIDTQIPLRDLNLLRGRYGKNKDFQSGTEYIVTLMRKKDSKFRDVYKKLKQSLKFSMDDLGIITKDFFTYEFELKETKDFPLIQSLIKELSNDKRIKFRSKYAQSSLFDATFLDSSTGDLNPNIKALIQSSDESWADGIGKLSAYSKGDSSTVVATELRNLVTELEPVIIEGQTIPKTETNKIVIEDTPYEEITPKAVKEFFSREYLMSDADLKFLTTGTGYESARRSDNTRKLSTYLEEKDSTLANLRTLFNNRIKRVSKKNKDFENELNTKIDAVSELGYEIIENNSRMLNTEIFAILNYFEYLDEIDSTESKSIISEFENYYFIREDELGTKKEKRKEDILIKETKSSKNKMKTELSKKVYYLVYEGDSPYDANNLLAKLKLAFKRVPPRSIKGSKIIVPKKGATSRRKFDRERPDILEFSRKIRSVKVDIKENVPQLLELFTEVANKVGTTEQALINYVTNDPTTQSEFSFASFIALPAYIERKVEESKSQFRAFTTSVTNILSAIKEGDDKEDIEDEIEEFIDEVVGASSKMLNLYVKESMDYLKAFLSSLNGEPLSYVYSVKRIVGKSSLVSKFKVEVITKDD